MGTINHTREIGENIEILSKNQDCQQAQTPLGGNLLIPRQVLSFGVLTRHKELHSQSLGEGDNREVETTKRKGRIKQRIQRIKSKVRQKSWNATL